jgi:hypothetical protein
MSSNPLSKFMDEEDFAAYMILALIFIILTIVIIYLLYIFRLEKSECSFMDKLYGSNSSYIHSINESNEDFKYKLFDYYIKTAYNACSGGGYKNDFVDICTLKSVLKEGVRGLDFEIYSIDDEPVVATSTQDSYYIKETYNYVRFADVMNTINNNAFGGGAPNPDDPIIIHLRFKSNNQKMYSKMATIFESCDRRLGKDYSYENSGKNVGGTPLLELRNKIVLIVDKSNNSFLENADFLEFVNMTSNSVFSRAMHYDSLKNTPDINELQEFNKRSISIILPDKGVTPTNPSGIFAREAGCQMVAMRYQYIDGFLEENKKFFDEQQSAFHLKPDRLRYEPVYLSDPTPQDPALSYETRNAATDYYNFNF